MTDRFGREFAPGVRVAYAVRVGNTAELVVGEIVRVTPIKVWGWDPVAQARALVDSIKLTVRAPGRWVKRDTTRTISNVYNVIVVVAP